MKSVGPTLASMFALLILSAGITSTNTATQLSCQLQGADAVHTRISTKFAEFIVTEDFSIDDMKARLDDFYDHELRDEPNSMAYVILYRGKCRSSRYTLKVIKDYLMLRGLPAPSIRTIHGGYRDEPAMELWIGSKDAQPPKPTPTYRSKSRKRC